MKKLLSLFLGMVCFLGSVSAQNPTLVYPTNDVKITGGPVGKVLIGTNFVGKGIGTGTMTVALTNSAGINLTGGSIFMNGLTISNLATATSGSNAVNLTQLQSATNAIASTQFGFLNMTNFSSPGTNIWVVPVGTKKLYIECNGAGGSGNTVGGGGGGGYAAGIISVTNNQPITVIVALGATGGSGVDPVNDSSAGGIIAKSGTSAMGASGPGGGNGGGNVGQITIEGGEGFPYFDGASAVFGGGQSPRGGPTTFLRNGPEQRPAKNPGSGGNSGDGATGQDGGNGSVTIFW